VTYINTPCANYYCTIYGCQGSCGRWRVPTQGYYTSPISIQQGCICPPTSEQTCQNPTCPRKPSAAQGTSASGRDPQGHEAKPAGPVPAGDAPHD